MLYAKRDSESSSGTLDVKRIFIFLQRSASDGILLFFKEQILPEKCLFLICDLMIAVFLDHLYPSSELLLRLRDVGICPLD